MYNVKSFAWHVLVNIDIFYSMIINVQIDLSTFYIAIINHIDIFTLIKF